MATRRTSLFLALALLAAVLANGFGACLAALPEVSCGCLEETATSGMAGNERSFQTSEETAASAPSARDAVAVLGGGLAERPLQAPPSPSMPLGRRVPAAGSPPLYLSHCAFLC